MDRNRSHCRQKMGEHEGLVWSMENSFYEDLFCKPKVGYTFIEAAEKHMTEWVNILERLEPADAYYYFRRLRDLKIDSLNADMICIDHLRFPVYFKINEKFSKYSKIASNLHSMLVTTRFPGVPASEVDWIYPFEKVEEVEDLPYLTFEKPMGRRTLSYEEAIDPEVKLMQRPKIDGYNFMKARLPTQSVLVGMFWLTVRDPNYLQLEFVPEEQCFYAINPEIGVATNEDVFTVLPHNREPYTGKVPEGSEGLMITLINNEEVRIKVENTVEIDCGDLGIVEVVERESVLVPVKSRPMKTPTSHPLYKLRSQPTVLCLTQQEPKPCVRKHGTQDYVKVENDQIIYQRKWYERRGIVYKDVFYFWEREESSPSSIIYSTRTFFQIDNSIARVTNIKREVGTVVDKFSQNGNFNLISLLVLNQTGKILLNYTSTGLYDVPSYIAEMDSMISPEPLLDRVFYDWSKVMVEGPYPSGHIFYYVVKMNESLQSKYLFYDHDVTQQHYRVTMILMDYQQQHKWKPSRFVSPTSTSSPLTSSGDLGIDLIYRMSRSFNIKLSKEGNWYLFETSEKKFDTLFEESVIMSTLSKEKKDRKKQRKKKNNSNASISIEKSVVLAYRLRLGQKKFDRINLIIQQKDLVSRSWLPEGSGVVFPSIESQQLNVAFLSSLLYFYEGPKVQDVT